MATLVTSPGVNLLMSPLGALARVATFERGGTSAPATSCCFVLLHRQRKPTEEVAANEAPLESYIQISEVHNEAPAELKSAVDQTKPPAMQPCKFPALEPILSLF